MNSGTPACTAPGPSSSGGISRSTAATMNAASTRFRNCQAGAPPGADAAAAAPGGAAAAAGAFSSAALPPACRKKTRRETGTSVVLLLRHLRAAAPRLRQADRDGLLRVRHLLAGAAALEVAFLELVHHLAHLA